MNIPSIKIVLTCFSRDLIKPGEVPLIFIHHVHSLVTVLVAQIVQRPLVLGRPVLGNISRYLGREQQNMTKLCGC